MQTFIVISFQKGIHATWEVSQSCQAWRLPLFKDIQKRHVVHFSNIRGCQVNLRDKLGQLVSKGWRIMTSHPLLASRMDLPCRCDSKTKHVPCEGQITKQTAFYTKEFAVRVCEAILQKGEQNMLIRELQGFSDYGDLFGMGTMCLCEDGQRHDAGLTCGHCNPQTRPVPEIQVVFS